MEVDTPRLTVRRMQKCGNTETESGRDCQPDTPARAASRAPKNNPVATKKKAPRRIITLFLGMRVGLGFDCICSILLGGLYCVSADPFHPLTRKGKAFPSGMTGVERFSLSASLALCVMMTHPVPEQLAYLWLARPDEDRRRPQLILLSVIRVWPQTTVKSWMA